MKLYINGNKVDDVCNTITLEHANDLNDIMVINIIEFVTTIEQYLPVLMRHPKLMFLSRLYKHTLKQMTEATR